MTSIGRVAAGISLALGLEVAIVVQDAGAQGTIPDQPFEMGVVYGVNRDLISLAEPFALGLSLAGWRDVRIDAESTNQRLVGVNASCHVARYVILFTELLYDDLGESRVSGRVGLSPRANFTVHPRIFEWTGGARVQFPAGTWRVRPYFGGGVGIMGLKIDATGPGDPVSESASELVYHFDVGTRVLLTRHFGVSPEFRLVQIPDDTFYRAVIGAVFRF